MNRLILPSLLLILAGCGSKEPTKAAYVEPKARDKVALANAVRPPKIAFRNATKEAGIDFVHIHGGYGRKLMPETLGAGVCVLDYNGDGHQDLFFVNGCRWPHWKYPAPLPKPTGPALYESDGKGKFRDVTSEVGLAVECYGMGAVAGDIDNDGFPELFITTLNHCYDADGQHKDLNKALGRCFLFKNEGGKKFRDITVEANAQCPGWASAAAFLDYDRDGKLDLFVAHYVKWTLEGDLFCRLIGEEKSYCQPMLYEGQHCQLLHNLGNGKFEDVSSKAGVQVAGVSVADDKLGGRSASKALGVAVHDYDDDGWPDIAVANDTTPNFLFHNRGNGTFENIASKAGVELINERGSARGAMGIHWGYYRDGQSLGLAIANFSNEMNGLLRYDSEHGLFRDCAIAEGIGGPSRLPLKFGLFFFDYDQDGRIDLFTSNGHIEPEIGRIQAAVKHAQPGQLFWNTGPSRSGCYREVEEQDAGPDLFQPRVGRGAAFGDLDGDGDLDIALNNNNQPATILRNEANSGKAIRLRLRGATCNRDAFGARVKLWTGDKVQQAELSSGGSYLSQNEAVLTFGLGSHDKADKIEIRWPTKELKTTELTDLVAGFTYVVDEEKGVVEKVAFRR